MAMSHSGFGIKSNCAGEIRSSLPNPDKIRWVGRHPGPSDRKIWPWDLRDPKSRMTVLARPAAVYPTQTKSDELDTQGRQTVKYGHETFEIRNQEWLCWRGPAEIYQTDKRCVVWYTFINILNECLYTRISYRLCGLCRREIKGKYAIQIWIKHAQSRD
jgi:hypothetical protein